MVPTPGRGSGGEGVWELTDIVIHEKTCYMYIQRTVRIYRIITQSENPRFAQENPRMAQIRTLCITIYLHIQYLLAGWVQHAADCILLRLIESCVLQLVKTL